MSHQGLGCIGALGWIGLQLTLRVAAQMGPRCIGAFAGCHYLNCLSDKLQITWLLQDANGLGLHSMHARSARLSQQPSTVPSAL